MRKWLTLFLALLLIPLLVGQAAHAAGFYRVLEGETDALEDDGVVRMDVGELLYVTLSANATTGYAWVCNIADESVIALLGEGYTVDSHADPAMTGVGGAQHFFFNALSAGESEIVLRYKQTWMEDSEDGDLCTFMVVVE